MSVRGHPAGPRPPPRRHWPEVASCDAGGGGRRHRTRTGVEGGAPPPAVEAPPERVRGEPRAARGRGGRKEPLGVWRFCRDGFVPPWGGCPAPPVPKSPARPHTAAPGAGSRSAALGSEPGLGAVLREQGLRMQARPG